MRDAILGFGIVAMVSLIMLGIILSALKDQTPTTSYSVTITNGTPAIPYSSTLQADSVRYFCDTHVRVYVGKDSLDVKAKFITYKKN